MAERARRDARRNPSNLQLASNFDEEMRTLDFHTCQRCRARVISVEFNRGLCNSCRHSRTNLFSAENRMDIGTVQQELIGLTMLEENLIARVHPVVSVFKLRGQQRAFSGHVMNFVQHVEQVTTRLPHDPAHLNSILLHNRNTPDGVIQFRVRARRVRDALVWLKFNNHYYHDIIIDETVLDILPEDGDMISSMPNLQAPEELDERGEDAKKE